MRGISQSVAIAVILVAVLVAGGAAYLLTSSGGTQQPSQTTTTPSTSTSSGQTTTTPSTSTSSAGGNPADVKTAFETHLSEIGDRNVAGVLNDYSSGAVVVWTGEAAGLQGTYTGVGNIQLLYASALSSASQVSVRSLNYTQPTNSSAQVVIKAALRLTGQSSVLGPFNGTIQSQLVYQYSGGSWKIVNETWNFVKFNVQFAAGSTTFPEWQKIGPVIASRRGPDWLHNFAWDLGGPASATLVVVYAVAIAAILVVQSAWKRRK